MTGLGAADVIVLDAYRAWLDHVATVADVDPAGIRLELVAHRRPRSLVLEHWATLTEFEDPFGKAGLI